MFSVLNSKYLYQPCNATLYLPSLLQAKDIESCKTEIVGDCRCDLMLMKET